MTRLEQLRDYADALACRAYLTGVGSQKDLNDIVKALDELIELKRLELNLTDEEAWSSQDAA